MRCLHHVMWRGAMALLLLAFASLGVATLPPRQTPACTSGLPFECGVPLRAPR